MPVGDGGVPTTSTVSVGNTPTLLIPLRARSITSSVGRSSFTLMNTGNADVTIGGANVAAGVGPILIAQASSTTIPHSYTNTTSNQAYYGIVASGTGTIQVLEEICAAGGS